MLATTHNTLTLWQYVLKMFSSEPKEFCVTVVELIMINVKVKFLFGEEQLEHSQNISTQKIKKNNMALA